MPGARCLSPCTCTVGAPELVPITLHGTGTPQCPGQGQWEKPCPWGWAQLRNAEAHGFLTAGPIIGDAAPGPFPGLLHEPGKSLWCKQPWVGLVSCGVRMCL